MYLYFPGAGAGEMGEETGSYTPHKGVLRTVQIKPESFGRNL